MKRNAVIVLAILLWAASSPTAGLAQVKSVRMKIDGYLCGF